MDYLNQDTQRVGKLKHSKTLDCALFALLACTSQFAQANEPSVGKFAEISGKAWILHGTEKTAIQAGDVFKAGDVLVTGENAQIKIVIGNKEAALLAKQNTQFMVKKPTPESWFVDLDHGMLMSYVKPSPTRTKNHFKVKTRETVMGVRGTFFFIKSDSPKELFLCTCSGIVSIDDQVVVVGKHHDSARMIELKNDKPLASRLKPAEQGHDHSDQDAAELTKLIDSP